MDITKKIDIKIIILVFLIPSFLLSPFILKPDLLTSQNNDLRAFVVPLFTFFKQIVTYNKILPLWQNKFLTGYPILGDPQSIIMYPFNYISLTTDSPVFFIFYYFFHIFTSIVGILLLAKEIGLTKKAALLAAFLYSLSPKMIAHIESGHTNLYASFAYTPFTLLLFHKLIKKPSLKKAVLLGFFLSLVYILYVTTFYYLILLLFLYFLYQLFSKKELFIKNIKYFIIAGIFFSGFTLPELLASYELFPQLTRNLLNLEDVGGPVFAWRQFAWFLFNPKLIHTTQTEMVLYLGFFTAILAVIGFLYLNKKQKIITSFLLLISFLYAVGPKTFFYKYLFNHFPGVSLFRVPTRMWFIISLLMSLLAGIGFERIASKRQKIAFFFFIAAVIEYLYLGGARIYPKASSNYVTVPKNLYQEYFAKDKDYFRIYCTIHCPSFYDLQDYNIGFTTGYNPVQLSNYFWFIQKAGGYGFASYAPSIPPYQTFIDRPQPVAEKLGVLGVRYVISPYQVTDGNFKLENEADGFFLYKNILEKPRAYLVQNNNEIVSLKLNQDIPGYIEISEVNGQGRVVVEEIHTKGWKVYSDGKKENVDQEENVILSTQVEEGTKKITFSYEPLGTPFSWYILIATYISSAFILINKKIK